MGLGGLLYFWSKLNSGDDDAPGALSCDSFRKSTDSGFRSVAPGGRFWHGPADLRPPFGQGRPPFYASSAIAVKARGGTKKS
jgi:hypothetical protein